MPYLQVLTEINVIQSWRYKFPLLYRVALDVLPAQASAVSSERVFSSSKETDTLRRSSLSPQKIEELQILKFVYRAEQQEQVDLCEGLVADKAEISVIDVDPAFVDDLLAQGKINNLVELIGHCVGQ
jgi:hypothetical protein